MIFPAFLPFLKQLVVGIGLQLLGYLLMPKPPQPKPPEIEDLEGPTAESGRPINVVFGSITVKGLNLIGQWDKDINTRKAKVSKK